MAPWLLSRAPSAPSHLGSSFASPLYRFMYRFVHRSLGSICYNAKQLQSCKYCAILQSPVNIWAISRFCLCSFGYYEGTHEHPCWDGQESPRPVVLSLPRGLLTCRPLAHSQRSSSSRSGAGPENVHS